MAEIAFFRCNTCGNVVALLRSGGGTLTCCDQAMEKLVANSTDAAQEKHVPVVTKEGGKIKVTVGAVLHPMLPEHYIEWIALVTENGEKVEIAKLKPGDQPVAEFAAAGTGTAYAFCNKHGLWKADF